MGINTAFTFLCTVGTWVGATVGRGGATLSGDQGIAFTFFSFPRLRSERASSPSGTPPSGLSEVHLKNLAPLKNVLLLHLT